LVGQLAEAVAVNAPAILRHDNPLR
jgi:hypothetical protein